VAHDFAHDDRAVRELTARAKFDRFFVARRRNDYEAFHSIPPQPLNWAGLERNIAVDDHKSRGKNPLAMLRIT